MNISEIETIFKLAKLLFLTAFIIWLPSTILFLIIEGWHIKATHPVEIFFDKVASALIKNAFFLTVFCGISLLFNINNLNNLKTNNNETTNR